MTTITYCPYCGVVSDIENSANVCGVALMDAFDADEGGE